MNVSKEGKRFLLASLLIAVAAINTGNNLIYLILSLMCSMVCIALIILKVNLSQLSIDLSVERPVYVGEEEAVGIILNNNKRYITSYSVSVSSAGAVSPAYFQMVGPKGSATGELRVIFQKRGMYRYGDFSVTSGFPFILFSRKRALKFSAELVVYPALVEIRETIFEETAEGPGYAAGIAASGDEIYALREFRHGDDWRRIHWKASAKTAHLVVKEYSQYEGKKTTIIIDNLGHSSAGRGQDLVDPVFEKTVSIVASVAQYFLENGHHVRIMSCKKVIPFGSGTEHLFTILDILSLIRKEDAWESPEPAEGEGRLITVLQDSSSLLNRYSGMSHTVIYADTF